MSLEQLGPYRITRLLGRGGMGAVYEGVHTETGEHTAVKILSAVHADEPSFRARFAAEIETLKTLRHPHIVRLIGYGEQDGILFYSMELVTGRNLHEEMQGGKLFTWREVAEMAIQVCAALKHAHDHGVIHRDLKPANLLLAEDGTYKLTDFGIAKLFGATNLTSAGGVIGTIDFMAPEQAEGQAVTTRSDLYSLGGVMYALLTGRPPFSGRTAADVLHRMRNFEPQPIRRFNPDVPQELIDIIMQLLQRDPQTRIPTPLVLAKRLRAMLHGLASDAAALPSDEGEQPTDATPEGKGATKGGSPEGPTREISPSKLHEIPWEDETIDTSHARKSPVPSSSARARETETARSSGTLAQTRFTSIEEELRAERQQGDLTLAPTSDERPWLRLGSLVLLVLALILLAGAALQLARPTSADVLYERIGKAVQQSEGHDLLAARRDIDEFVQRYADDPRYDEVKHLQLDHDAHRLWRRLERDARKVGGVEYLSPIERGFVVAMREEAVSISSALEKYQAVLGQAGDGAALTETQQECLDAARHRAARLMELEPDQKSASEQRALLSEFADCDDYDGPEEGGPRGLIRLFGLCVS